MLPISQKIKNKIILFFEKPTPQKINNFIDNWPNYYQSVILQNIKLNYPFFFLLRLEIIEDLDYIGVFLFRLFHLDFYFSDYIDNIWSLIWHFLLFIFFISPVYWCIILMIKIYKKITFYVFLILDFLFLDIIFYKKNIFNKIYLLFRNIFFFLFYKFWFDILIDFYYFLYDRYNYDSLIFRWSMTAAKIIYYFAKFLELIIRFIRAIFDIIPKTISLIKYLFILLMKLLKKIKQQYLHKKLLFLWYCVRLPRWIFDYIKLKVKYFYRWFVRWIHVIPYWFFLNFKILLFSFVLKNFHFFFSIFFIDRRKKKILYFARIFAFLYRLFFWSFDRYVRVPIIFLYDKFNFKLFKIKNDMHYFYLVIYYKFWVYIYMFIIFCINIKIYIFMFIQKIINILIPYKILYFFVFFYDLIYNKYFIKKEENRILNYIFNEKLKNYKDLNFYHTKNLDLYNFYAKQSYDSKFFNLKATDFPTIPDTESFHYLFIYFSTFFCWFVDFFKLLLLFIIIYYVVFIFQLFYIVSCTP